MGFNPDKQQNNFRENLRNNIKLRLLDGEKTFRQNKEFVEVHTKKAQTTLWVDIIAAT